MTTETDRLLRQLLAEVKGLRGDLPGNVAPQISDKDQAIVDALMQRKGIGQPPSTIMVGGIGDLREPPCNHAVELAPAEEPEPTAGGELPLVMIKDLPPGSEFWYPWKGKASRWRRYGPGHRSGTIRCSNDQGDGVHLEERLTVRPIPHPVGPKEPGEWWAYVFGTWGGIQEPTVTRVTVERDCWPGADDVLGIRRWQEPVCFLDGRNGIWLCPVEPEEPVRQAEPVGTWGGYDDWIRWEGGVCPVGVDVEIMWVLADGSMRGPGSAGKRYWCHDAEDQCNIIAYRIVKPEPEMWPAERVREVLQALRSELMTPNGRPKFGTPSGAFDYAAGRVGAVINKLGMLSKADQ